MDSDTENANLEKKKKNWLPFSIYGCVYRVLVKRGTHTVDLDHQGLIYDFGDFTGSSNDPNMMLQAMFKAH